MTSEAATVDTAVAQLDSEKDLKGFYNIKGMSAELNMPSAISTERGVREFIKEKAPVPYDTQVKIKQDQSSINFDIKKAGSSAGIDIDFAVPAQATLNLLRTMSDQGRLEHLEKFPSTQTQVQNILALEGTINEMKQSGTENSDPALQNLVADYKILVGQLVQSDLSSMDMDDVDNPQLRKAYESYIGTMPKLLYAKNNDGATLKTKYDQLINKTDISTIRSVYYDLDTKKDRGFYESGSRNAKKELMSNPIWLEEVSTMMKNSPAMAQIIAKESDKEYISEFERDIIKQLNNKIGPQMRSAYDNAVEVLGQDEADIQFKSVKDLFSLYDKISYKTVEDDLIENAYAPVSSFGIINEMNNPETSEEAFQKDVEERIAKLATGKRAQEIAYDTVWGSGNNNSSSAAAGGGSRVERFASKVRT
jgi:hypothetical protein